MGYACINMQLSYPQKYGGKEKGVKPITTGRSMIKRTFLTKGVDYASELTLANAMDLDKIMDWNILNGYNFFRITSGLAPWKSEYEWNDLKDIERIRMYLHSAGVKAKTHNLRITSHPGPFNVLTSPHPHVVDNCVSDLTDHGEVFDMMGLSRTPHNKINIHIGGAYGDKESAMERFCVNFERLPDSVKSRLTVENDDKPNLYSTEMLYEGVHKRVGIPIVFDSHHFEIGPQDQDYHDAYHLARSTWPTGIRQQCHHSNSRKRYEDPKANKMAHSTWFYTPFETFGNHTDVVLECKAKELAVMKYRKDFQSGEKIKPTKQLASQAVA